MSLRKTNINTTTIKAVKQSDERAFRAMFDAYSKDVFAYSMSFVKNKALADEVVQDVFLKVWLHREQLNPDANFTSYLFTITKNTTLNILRKAASDQKLREVVFYHKPTFENSTEMAILDRDFEKIRLDAIGQLPPKRKRIFEMSRYEDKSYEEISRELNISLTTVKNQMSMALKTIRDFLRVNGDITLLLIALPFLS
ncbi:RNA polymerase sigma-70 factor [Membranihabitans marinus]|uniref:RNA polymerase sigma-70 factor n=1 Tax=Membranihabitans marinus TaxID=1227546 RepID=UPI001F46826C|nr:RNA polymerase sigma-70 factor [Membranihabitans marinus]